MSFHIQEVGLMENIPYAAFHNMSRDYSELNYKDAVRLGLPFIDAADLVRDQKFHYRRLSYFPFHGQFGVCEYTFEPAFIRKRNQRERHRVRCVNEGYARLREHLPREFEDKRLSKVETLRAAIDYIKHLQSLLELKAGIDGNESSSDGE